MAVQSLRRCYIVIAAATQTSISPVVGTLAFAPNLSSTHSSPTSVPSVKNPPFQQHFTRSSCRLFSSPPTRYLLTYDYVPEVLERRGPYREGHLDLANGMISRGVCVSGGPTLTPGDSAPNGAVFIFKSKEAAEKFVSEDPYVSNGIVTGHSIMEWSVVVGTN